MLRFFAHFCMVIFSLNFWEVTYALMKASDTNPFVLHNGYEIIFVSTLALGVLLYALDRKFSTDVFADEIDKINRRLDALRRQYPEREHNAIAAGRQLLG